MPRVGRIPSRLLSLTLLLGFACALVLAWAHPTGLQHTPDHRCHGGTHLAGGEGPTHHPAHGCAACHLLHAPLLAPPLSIPDGPPPAPSLARAARRVARPWFPVPLGFAPRGPPV